MKRTSLFVLLASVAPLAGCGADPEATSGPGAQNLAARLNAERSGASAPQAIRLREKAYNGGTLCVDVRDQSSDNGTRVQLYACANGQRNQSFTVDGKLVRVFGNKCLNVVDGVNQNGAGVQIWDCSNHDKNMLWTVQNGHLRWEGTDKCLDVTNGKFQNNAPLQLWTCNDASSHQTFVFGQQAPSSAPSGASSTFGTTMNVQNWTQEVHGAYAFNNEQQNYTNGGRNVSFNNGVATLVARPTGGASWTSARLSGDPMGPLPWYLEADIVAPTGQGSWPAFWLTARGLWPQGGEIDIMEQINGTGQTHISTHWGAQTGIETFQTHEIINNVDARQRHRYGVWVSAQGLQFYLDGGKVGRWVTFPPESNFTTIASQMVPIVNIAMGGNWPGNAPQSTGEQKMTVYRVSRANQPPS